jgi:hypothetical protein
MSDELQGSKILKLFERFTLESLMELFKPGSLIQGEAKNLYQGAYERRLSDPKTAIDKCKMGLDPILFK